jgi:hypothetical protein
MIGQSLACQAMSLFTLAHAAFRNHLVRHQERRPLRPRTNPPSDSKKPSALVLAGGRNGDFSRAAVRHADGASVDGSGLGGYDQPSAAARCSRLNGYHPRPVNVSAGCKPAPRRSRLRRRPVTGRGRWQRRFWHGRAQQGRACRRFGERLCQRLTDTPLPASPCHAPTTPRTERARSDGVVPALRARVLSVGQVFNLPT